VLAADGLSLGDNGLGDTFGDRRGLDAMAQTKAQDAEALDGGQVTEQMTEATMSNEQKAAERQTKLTARQEQVLTMLWNGATPHEIAGQVCIHVQSVRNLLRHAAIRMECRGVVMLCRRALQLGILKP
jgi:DNA-binding NarL/FixJ family response regulator